MGGDNVVNPTTSGIKDDYVLYTRRWLILAVFSLVVVGQNAFWNTFGAIEPFAVEHYNTNKKMINFLGSLGPIVFIPCSFVSVWFVDKFGLRKSVVTMALLCGLGALIRSVYIKNFEYNIIFPIIGQCLNNLSGPFSMILQPKLSGVWFAPKERTVATAIGFQANVIGLSGCYFISMLVTKSSDVPFLLYVYAAYGVVVLLLTIIYFPEKPPTPPSYTSEMAGVAEDVTPFAILKNSWKCVTASWSAAILIFFGSCPGGIYSAWGAMLVEIVTPLGYTETQAEWFGVWAMVAGGIGGVLFGKFHDIYRHYKLWLVILFIADTCVFVWFTLLTSHKIANSYAMAMTANILGGLFMGAPSGILYEGIVELTYPISEQTGANVFSVLFNVWSLFFLVAGDYITPTLINWLMSGSALVTAIMLMTVKERYLRSDVDRKKGYEVIQ